MGTSGLARRFSDEARRGIGCTLISGLKLQIGYLRALMEFTKNDLISYRML
jgi:hypothetical protein